MKHNVHCHKCHTSAKQNVKGLKSFVDCTKCRRIYCTQCIDTDPDRLTITSEGCVVCRKKCCCNASDCAIQHRHCYNYNAYRSPSYNKLKSYQVSTPIALPSFYPTNPLCNQHIVQTVSTPIASVVNEIPKVNNEHIVQAIPVVNNELIGNPFLFKEPTSMRCAQANKIPASVTIVEDMDIEKSNKPDVCYKASPYFDKFIKDELWKIEVHPYYNPTDKPPHNFDTCQFYMYNSFKHDNIV